MIVLNLNLAGNLAHFSNILIHFWKPFHRYLDHLYELANHLTNILGHNDLVSPSGNQFQTVSDWYQPQSVNSKIITVPFCFNNLKTTSPFFANHSKFLTSVIKVPRQQSPATCHI